MTSGPIEFLGDEPARDQITTEFGGTGGLIQPEFVDAQPAHSELTEQEKRDIFTRYGVPALSALEAKSGELLRPDGEAIVDPATGRVLDPADVADVTGKSGKEAGLRDLKPGG